MEGFRFSVGDVVVHKASDSFQAKGVEQIGEGEKKRARAFWANRATRYFIIERLMQECHGGIQRHYLCRIVNNEGNVADKCVQLIEAEVEKYEVTEPIELL